MIRISFVIAILFSSLCFSQMKPAQDFSASKVKFTFMSSDGSIWIDCTHARTDVPHGWTVQCADKKFSLHLFMTEYFRENESTYEFHYWADEIAVLSETHTQSTWVTVDRAAKTKRIVSYLGFQKDSTQLRFEVEL